MTLAVVEDITASVLFCALATMWTFFFFFNVTDVTPATFETPEVHPGGLPLGNKAKAGVKAAEEGRRIMFL